VEAKRAHLVEVRRPAGNPLAAGAPPRPRPLASPGTRIRATDDTLCRAHWVACCTYLPHVGRGAGLHSVSSSCRKGAWPAVCACVPCKGGAVQFMKQHLGSRPAIVLGPSLGGAAALDLALHHPELVRDSKGHEARWGGDGAQGTRRHSAAWLLAFSSLPACVWGSKHPLKGARGHELNGKGPSSLTSGCSPIVACVHSALPLIVAVLSARASLKSRGCQGGAELPPELCAGSAEGPGVVCQLSPPMPRQLPSCPSFPAFSAASPACVATRLQVAGLMLVDAQGYAEGIGGWPPSLSGWPKRGYVRVVTCPKSFALVLHSLGISPTTPLSVCGALTEYNTLKGGLRCGGGSGTYPHCHWAFGGKHPLQHALPLMRCEPWRFSRL